MEAFCALMDEQVRTRALSQYMGDVLWTIARALYREYPYPSATELLDGKGRQRDTRTGREIIDGLYSRMKGGEP